MLQTIITAAGERLSARIIETAVPILELKCVDADALAAHLGAAEPPIHVGLGRRHEGIVLISPVALSFGQAAIIGNRLRSF